MLGLTDEKLIKYAEKIIERTKHSEKQVRVFFSVLQNRMDTLEIVSLHDLFVRYDNIYRCDSSKRVELLKEISGVFHLANLQILMDILEKEQEVAELIKYLNSEIEKEIEKRKSLDKSSTEYRESLEREMNYLERQKYYLD